MGFSLVELLVVIAVIGILASAAIVVINPVAQMEKARDSERKADLKQIQAALELYRSDQGEYPSTLGDLSSGSVKYLSQVPQDPKSGSYSYSKTGGDYSISACAERLTASDDDVIADATCTKRFRIIFYSP